MSDFRPDTKGAVVVTFFRLTCSVALWGVRDAANNNTVVCSQCLSHTGPAPAHGACTLPAHTAQALGCSTGNRLGLAVGCMHLPGLSRSGSGTRVVPRGGLHFVQLVGPVFCALLRSEQLSDEVFGKRGCCDLSPPPFLPLSFLGVQPVYILRRMLTIQNPKKS